MSVAAPSPIGESAAKARASYAGAFAGVAEEARRGAEACQRLQESALHLLDNYAGPDRARLIGELQHLDALTQMLASLSSFAASASTQAQRGASVDFEVAVADIGLSDMAYRLRLAAFEQATEDWRLDGPCGDIDLF